MISGRLQDDSEEVVKIEDVSKLYRLGEVGSTTLAEDVTRWWYRLRGKGDPFAIVGQTNNRESEGESDYVWALKGIDLDVRRGERLGIIGVNGAGKSTLLKILSKITGPTTGRVRIRGRLASLLEVGTGFHPEMTGRENIYMNGAILGMTRREIKRKLDDIVDFAGVTRYLDTPVKRYSSGMNVRLGFAVAAHLEPDILVVDEVLAVGDAEFQRRAIGKMNEVSAERGRTILFVSHNMNAVSTLCTRCVVLSQGMLVAQGPPRAMIRRYLEATEALSSRGCLDLSSGADRSAPAVVTRVWTLGADGSERFVFAREESVTVRIDIEISRASEGLIVGLDVSQTDGVLLFRTHSFEHRDGLSALNREGIVQARCSIPSGVLNPGRYVIGVILASDARTRLQHIPAALEFEVVPEEALGGVFHKFPGLMTVPCAWQIDQ